MRNTYYVIIDGPEMLTQQRDGFAVQCLFAHFLPSINFLLFHHVLILLNGGLDVGLDVGTGCRAH